MKTLSLKASKSYNIHIGNNILERADELLCWTSLGNHAVIVTNETLAELYMSRIRRTFTSIKGISCEIIVLPDTEKIKSFKYMQNICEHVGGLDYRKMPFIVSIGGGVVGDLCGFCASIVKRGRPFINIPTSLLAMVDSSIGGKTAIDLKAGKNLVGSFWQPSAVICDTDFLKTLPADQVREGLSESIKYGFIYDKNVLTVIENSLNSIFAGSPIVMNDLVYRCVDIKRRIVQQDEREDKGIRTILNFGHTFAHAFEACSNYRLSHGKAVSLGMIAALKLSELCGVLSHKELMSRLEAVLNAAKMPVRTAAYDLKKLIETMNKDKKFISGKNRFVLIEDLEKPLILQGVTLALVKKAFQYVFKN